jgi:hypothetical protein
MQWDLMKPAAATKKQAGRGLYVTELLCGTAMVRTSSSTAWALLHMHALHTVALDPKHDLSSALARFHM